MDMIEKLAQDGHLSEEQAERVKERVQSFVKAAQEDSDLYAEAQEKLGGMGRTMLDTIKGMPAAYGSNLATALPATGAAMTAMALIGGSAGAAHDAYQSARKSSQKAKAYKTMMEEAGERLEGLAPKQIQQGFNTLHRVNPDYAQDPVVAAEFIRETSRSEAYPFQMLNVMRSGAPEQSAGVFQNYGKALVAPSAKDTMPIDEQSPQEQVLQEKLINDERIRLGLKQDSGQGRQ